MRKQAADRPELPFGCRRPASPDLRFSSYEPRRAPPFRQRHSVVSGMAGRSADAGHGPAGPDRHLCFRLVL